MSVSNFDHNMPKPSVLFQSEKGPIRGVSDSQMFADATNLLDAQEVIRTLGNSRHIPFLYGERTTHGARVSSNVVPELPQESATAIDLLYAYGVEEMEKGSAVTSVLSRLVLSEGKRLVVPDFSEACDMFWGMHHAVQSMQLKKKTFYKKLEIPLGAVVHTQSNSDDSLSHKIFVHMSLPFGLFAIGVTDGYSSHKLED